MENGYAYHRKPLCFCERYAIFTFPDYAKHQTTATFYSNYDYYFLFSIKIHSKASPLIWAFDYLKTYQNLEFVLYHFFHLFV